MQRRRQYRWSNPVFTGAVKTAAVYGPQLARHVGVGGLGAGQRRLEGIVEPDEVKRRADPGNAGNDVKPADQEAAPVQEVIDQEVTVSGRGLGAVLKEGVGSVGVASAAAPPGEQSSGAQGALRGTGVADVGTVCDCSAAAEIFCINCAATATAMAAGHLLLMPSTPIGQTNFAITSGPRPVRATRDRKRAALLSEPISPSHAKSLRSRSA